MRRESPESVSVVPIGEEHIEGYHRLLQSLAVERRYLPFDPAPPLDTIRRSVAYNIAHGVPHYVAVCGDDVIGWCDILSRPFEGFTHVGRLGIGVHSDFRRRGIGQTLIIQAVEAAKEKGLERIELEIFSSNTPAISLCEKMGFVVEGVKRRARKVEGNYDDIIQMVLFI